MKPHGIRGEVRVLAFAPGAPNLQEGRLVYLGGDGRRVIRAREDRGAWILKLEALTNRTAAEGLRGVLIEAPDADVQRADPESYFLHELVGLRVVTAAGRELGQITEVLQPGANDVYVVRGEWGELLVPAIGDVVSGIDLQAGVMTITPLAGMLDESQ